MNRRRSTDRDQAVSAAKSDPERALRLARQVSDPWYRAQALAWVARFGPAGSVQELALESMRAAREGSDPYQRLAGLAWPVRMLAERGMRDHACSIVTEALAELRSVDPPSSRSEAAYLLFQAAFDVSSELREQLASLLVEIASSDTYWRTHRNVVDAISMLRPVAPALAASLAAGIPSPKLQGRIARQAQRQPRCSSGDP